MSSAHEREVGNTYGKYATQANAMKKLPISMTGSLINLDTENSDRSHLYKSAVIKESLNKSTGGEKTMQTARINIEKLSIPVLRKSRDETTRMNSSINARFNAKRPKNNLLKSIGFD